MAFLEARILLRYQLLFQVSRAPRYRLPRLEEEAPWFVSFFFSLYLAENLMVFFFTGLQLSYMCITTPSLPFCASPS